MAIDADLMEIVRILDEKGYGWLAGEVMTEIDLGREVDEEGDLDAMKAVEEPDDKSVVRRVPIPPEEQITAAISMLRLRLVEPARALAEAERIAGRLSDRDGVRIRFVGPSGEADDRGFSEARPGDAAVADKLDDVFARILSASRMREA